MSNIQVKLSGIIGPSFYDVHKAIKNSEHTHYWLKGGRGSGKSSFISIEIILGIMKNSNSNAVVLRKVGLNLKDSVFEQLCWAIGVLKVDQYWSIKQSPLGLVYNPTGQRILFRGADKPKKIKSIKIKKGYIRYIWYEEVDEFNGSEEIRNINQSLMRGGSKFDVFYSYNPPQNQRNWVNREVLDVRNGKLVHSSNYLQMPLNWLGEQFLIEAEHLKNTKPKQYAHEYLGEVTGTGTEVFENIKIQTLSKEEIAEFDRIYMGVDWGWFPDPFCWVKAHYDATRRKLYVFDELYLNRMSNEQTFNILTTQKGVTSTDEIIADSAEPKSIADYKFYGLIRTRPAEKGKMSVEYSMKWLQSLEAIIIDSDRCPNTAKEFLEYEHEKNNQGDIISGYPDKKNHSIDAVRYAMNRVWKKRGQ